MFNLRRLYNDNKGKFWTVVLVLLGAIFFVQVANNYYKNKNNQKENQSNTILNTQDSIINNQISGKLESSVSLSGESGASGKNLEQQVKVIDNFINNCNAGKIEEAYALLTTECKEELFPSLESFINKYYNKVFSTNKTYNVQNWIGNTYKVKLTEDALTTGKVNQDFSYLQEHMTVVKENTEYKLNINNYIGRTNIDKTTTINGMTINTLTTETYMDYSEYTIKIQNNTDKTILLDNGEEADNIYLLDDNNVKEYANTGEIVYDNLRLLPGETKRYTFKFSNTYSTARKIKYLVFEGVIMDYDEYNQMTDKDNYNEFRKISVNV